MKVQAVRMEHCGVVAALWAKRVASREDAANNVRFVTERGGGRGSQGGLPQSGLSCGLGDGVCLSEPEDGAGAHIDRPSRSKSGSDISAVH